MEIKVHSLGGEAGTIQLSDEVFGREFNEALVHQVVTAYMARGRQATKSWKGRSDVRGGGAKPWRQKGTGRARAGSIRSPLWRTGGKALPHPRVNYEQKINKKMWRSGIRSILSELVRQERLVLVDGLTLDAPKTKALVAKLTELGLPLDALIVVEAFDDKLALAARNIPYVHVTDADHVDPVSLIDFEKVVMTRGAAKKLEERLA